MYVYIVFSKLKNILLKIHLLPTPDREHSKVFENILNNRFQKRKEFKGHPGEGQSTST